MENKNMKQIILLLAVTISISLVLGQGATLHFDNNMIIEAITTTSQPLTTPNQLSTATNLQQKWDQIPEDLRKSYLETYSEDAAQKLSSDNLVEDFTWERLTDPDNPDAWKELSKDNDKTLKVLQERYGAQITGSDPDFSQSGWASRGDEKMFVYKKDVFVSDTSLAGNDPHIFRGDHLLSQKGDKIVQIYNGVEWHPQATPTPSLPQPAAAAAASPCGSSGCSAARYASGAQAGARTGAQAGANFGPFGQALGGAAGGAAGALSASASSITPGLDAIATQFSQVFSAFQQIAGAIPPKKDEIPPKLADTTPTASNAGNSFTRADPNSPFVRFEGEAELRGDQIITKSGKATIQNKEGDVGAVLKGLKGQPGKFTASNENLAVENGGVLVSQQVVGAGNFNLKANGIPGSDPSNPTQNTGIDSTASLSPTTSILNKIKNIFQLNSLLTGKAITTTTTTNSLILEGHNLDASGKIDLYQLKSFNNIRIGSGGDTNLFNGNNQFQFEKQRTLTNTLFHNLPYGGDIYNKLDQNNVIEAQDYNDALGLIIVRDSGTEIRTSITDIVTTANSNLYPQLIIAEHRLEMFS